MSISEPEAKAAAAMAARTADSVETVLKGKRDAILKALVAVLGGGHLLIEDLPGVGKTTLAQALSRALGLGFSRIQFTSDLLPSDLMGAQVFDQKTTSFSFRPGPVFSQVVLADEINRAPPRTQSALLEAMSEKQVTADGVTHPLPKPFIVLATQNPAEQSGTYPLPDSQLDRFMLRISLGYPAAAVERRLLESSSEGSSAKDIQPIFTAEKLCRIQEKVQSVRVESSVADYIVRLIQATRETKLLAVGASTRGLLALSAAAKAAAVIEGRTFLTPDDVKSVAVQVLAHRIRLAGTRGQASEGARAEAEQVVSAIVERCEVPI